MQIKKGVFIYSEKYERTLIRRKSKHATIKAVCQECGVQVEWLTPEEVSAVTNRKIEETELEKSNDKFHLRATNKGRLLFCLNSIFKTDEK